MPLPYGALLAVYWIAENAGEIKEAGSLKANLTHILGSNVFGAVLIIATSLALVSVIGQDFLSSLGYLFFTGKPEYMLAQPPYAYFLASIATNNSIIISLIFFGLLISGVQISYNTVLAGSRNLMAASFDRIFFEKAAHVSERFHMPTYSVLAMYIIPMILTPVYLYTGFGTMLLGATMANAILFIATSVSAMILPWRRPEIYRASPASKYSVAGVPAISIIGAINLIFNLTVASIIFTTPAYGLVNLPSQVFLAATFLLWIPVYYGFRWYRAKQGINVDLAFKEIPPE
jgi:amino acid transporter